MMDVGNIGEKKRARGRGEWGEHEFNFGHTELALPRDG